MQAMAVAIEAPISARSAAMPSCTDCGQSAPFGVSHSDGCCTSASSRAWAPWPSVLAASTSAVPTASSPLSAIALVSVALSSVMSSDTSNASSKAACRCRGR